MFPTHITGIDNRFSFVKFFLKKNNNLIIIDAGKNKMDKIDIWFLSQNLGLKKFIYNYLYIFF